MTMQEFWFKLTYSNKILSGLYIKENKCIFYRSMVEKLQINLLCEMCYFENADNEKKIVQSLFKNIF